MPDRRYYRQHRERMLAASRAWKEANPERTRKHNREHMRRAAIRERRLEQRRARGRAWYAEHREQERARARRFREEHPEKLREYQLRFRERHPDRAAAQGRRATQKWRDGNAEKVRENQRATAAQRREEDPDAFRRWYQANLEQQRARGREASRLRSRLKKLGLPPRKIQRVYANDRRANDRAASDFFERRRTAAELTSLQREPRMVYRRPTATQLAVIQARQRVMSAPELRIAGQHLQDRLRAAKARDLARAFFPDVAQGVFHRHGGRLRREIEQDSIARQHRGAEPYDVDDELTRRVRREAAAQAVALAKRSNDEDQMRRLVNASFPTSPKVRRDRTGAAPGTAQRPQMQERPGIER